MKNAKIKSGRATNISYKEVFFLKCRLTQKKRALSFNYPFGIKIVIRFRSCGFRYFRTLSMVKPLLLASRVSFGFEFAKLVVKFRWKLPLLKKVV